METIDTDDLAWSETDEGRTRFRRKRLASAARDGRPATDDGLGASLYELPSGARA